MIIDVIMRWLHIFSVIAAVGGLLFLRLVLIPAAKTSLSEEQHGSLFEAVIRRWRVIVMLSITLLVISGFYNFFSSGLPKGAEVPLYHPLFGIKFLLALTVFFLASALLGRSEIFAPFRANPGKWISLNILLAALVVMISGILRNLG